VIFKKSPIFIISLIYFQLNLGENGKCNYSSEEYHRNPKASRGFLFTVFKRGAAAIGTAATSIAATEATTGASVT
jgi:hypothetical protein